jgi:hypothetical protein
MIRWGAASREPEDLLAKHPAHRMTVDGISSATVLANLFTDDSHVTSEVKNNGAKIRRILNFECGTVDAHAATASRWVNANR